MAEVYIELQMTEIVRNF